MAQRYIWVFLLTDSGYCFAPQAGGIEHVCFIHTAQTAISLASHVEAHTGYALNFRNTVHFGIVGSLYPIYLLCSTLPKIDATRELTHDHNIE